MTTTIYHLPEQFRATAARIPPDVLKSLELIDAVARVIEHDRLFDLACSSGFSAVTAQPLFAAAAKVLSALPPAELAKARDGMHRAALQAPTSVMAGAASTAAGQLVDDNPQPSEASLAAARKAMAKHLVKTRPGLLGPGVRMTGQPGQLRYERETPTINRSATTTDDAPMLYKGAATDPREAQATEYERLAYELTDPQARAGYLQMAADVRATTT